MADETAQAVQGAAPTGAPGPEDQAAKEAIKEGATQTNHEAAVADSTAPVSGSDTGDTAAPAEEPAYQPQPVELHDGGDDGFGSPTSEDDQLLFGPTQMPQEPVTAGSDPMSRNAPPADIDKWLPSLNRAASDPNAPALLKNLAALINYHLGQ